MKPLTPADVWRIGWQKFVVEKQPPGWDATADNGKGNCVYRGDGCRCLIGHALPDSVFPLPPRAVNLNVTCLLERYAPVQECLDYRLVGWGDLQYCHDDAARDWADKLGDFHELIEANLRDFAKHKGIAIPEAA